MISFFGLINTNTNTIQTTKENNDLGKESPLPLNNQSKSQEQSPEKMIIEKAFTK